MHTPELYLSFAEEAFAGDGSFAEPRTREQFERVVRSFTKFTRAATA